MYMYTHTHMYVHILGLPVSVCDHTRWLMIHMENVHIWRHACRWLCSFEYIDCLTPVICVCEHRYTHVNVDVSACIHTYRQRGRYMYVYWHVHMRPWCHGCMYICVCICTYTYYLHLINMCTHDDPRAHTYTHAYMHGHLRTNTQDPYCLLTVFVSISSFSPPCSHRCLATSRCPLAQAM